MVRKRSGTGGAEPVKPDDTTGGTGSSPIGVVPELPKNAILLPVTPAQLAACVENQLHALIHIIANPNSPPIDGGLSMITAGLDALARIVPTIPDKKD